MWKTSKKLVRTFNIAKLCHFITIARFSFDSGILSSDILITIQQKHFAIEIKIIYDGDLSNQRRNLE